MGRLDNVRRSQARDGGADEYSANLYTANPNIFIGTDGQGEFENNAVAFRHYVNSLGMSADGAAQRIIHNRRRI